MLNYLSEGVRISASSLRNRFFPQKYEGTAKEICQQVIKDCWNERYFQTSTTSFSQFWTRDFGWCTASLLKLGYQQEVQQTLRYAINRFKMAKKITTAITPGGRPFDFPLFAADSLPWFIHSIRIAKFPYYSYKNFLNREIQRFFNKVVNSETGLVKPETHFSSMKDYAVRKSSCYDNCMVGLLAKDLASLKLHNPFKKYDYPGLLKRHFWNGQYFYDDLRKEEYVAADANVFPFILGLCKDQEMLESALGAIRHNELDQPFPLKYTKDKKKVQFIWQEMFVKNYEGNALWTHMGPFYIRLMKEVDPVLAEQYKDKYTGHIEKHGNFLEVFTEKGKPFSSPFYYSDRGMLWAANYLML